MTEARTRPADPSLVEGDVRLLLVHLTVVLDGAVRRFHYVWLRDNSRASEDRVAQSSERKPSTADIREAVAPISVGYDPERGLDVIWNDGRACTYAPAWLRRHDDSDEPAAWLACSPRRCGTRRVGTTARRPHRRGRYCDRAAAYLDALASSAP